MRLIKKYNQSAFSLIEVLITLVLVSLIFTVFSTNIVTSTPRIDIDRFISKLEGAIFFCIDEAILKNKIIRLHFLLDKEPAEYIVEVANNQRFIRSKSGRTKKNAFSKISEFEDGNVEFPEDIKIIALGDSTNAAMIYDGEASIYFYPNGSRDRSVLILNNQDEIVTFEIPAFLKKFKTKYIKIEQVDNQNDLDDILLNKAKVLFTTWIKK